MFRRLGEKHRGFDLAMLPIGAYELVTFMADGHMSPREAVQGRADLQERQALVHHFKALQLGFESFEAPRAALTQSLTAAGLNANDFVALRPGEHLIIAAARVR